jgi:hypothetical protein
MGVREPHLATEDDHRFSAREETSMSTVETAITELDVVALVSPVDGWPAGTKGTVLIERPSYKLVEISNELGEALDEVFVTDDQIRLVWKCPPDDRGD